MDQPDTQPSLLAEPQLIELGKSYDPRKPVEPRNLQWHGGGPVHEVGTLCPCVWCRFKQWVFS